MNRLCTVGTVADAAWDLHGQLFGRPGRRLKGIEFCRDLLVLRFKGRHAGTRFLRGLAGHAICDRCVQLMVSMRTGRFPPPRVATTPGVLRRLEGDEAKQTRKKFAEIVCRFCGRGRAVLKPGGVAGSTPDTFICPDCIQRAEAELLAS